jgi:hypothetical protein
VDGGDLREAWRCTRGRCVPVAKWLGGCGRLAPL